MTIEQFIKRLQKWPSGYTVEDGSGRKVAAVQLDRCQGKKGVVWVRFRSVYCKDCGHEIRP